MNVVDNTYEGSKGKYMSQSIDRFIKSILSIIILLPLSACLNDSSGRLTSGSSIGSPSTEEAQTITEYTIVNDVLGGALSSTVKPDAFSFDEIKQKTMTLNAEFTSDTSEINVNFAFKDEDGADSLSITTSGKVEEIITPGTQGSILDFSPLKVLITFTNFQFTNACGVKQSFTGDMECRVDGNYNRNDSNFKGYGTCVSGTEAKRGNLVDHFNNEDHQLNFSVNFLVDGNPFTTESYSFTGQFFVDNRLVMVGSSAEQKNTCQSSPE